MPILLFFVLILFLFLFCFGEPGLVDTGNVIAIKATIPSLFCSYNFLGLFVLCISV